MNELHRQVYLSALGVDSYMPRWHLPYAPVSIACEFPQAFKQVATPNVDVVSVVHPARITPAPMTDSVVNTSPVNHLIGDMLEVKKAPKSIAPISAADILAQLNEKPVLVEPFSLSIWRPLASVMIIDSRNTRLALPTELLLNNMLRSMFFKQSFQLQEEVLRWPMIENSFTKRTAQDARNELQTWLSVQQEIRPIRYLLLMGENAINYLSDETPVDEDITFQQVSVANSTMKALLLPSLNQLLQRPALKQKLLSALSAIFPVHNESI